MKKVELYKYGKDGWEFCILGKEWFRTDAYGDGLYLWCWDGRSYNIESDGTKSEEYDYNLVLGCNKFWLPESYNAAYKKIRRYFADVIEFGNESFIDMWRMKWRWNI